MTILLGDNPWRRLPLDPPYVLSEDREAIERFNERAESKHQFRTDLLPEPFLGVPDARVVLLNLNPGFCDRDVMVHADRSFKEVCRANLTHEPRRFPFFFFSDAARETPGHQWWQRRLRRVIESSTVEHVANRVLCVEWFPYHSRAFKRMPELLPSQQYSFDLVKAAVRRGSIIVAMRRWRQWVGAVPELETYENVLHPNSRQCAYISPGNYPSGFETLIAAIR